MRFRSNSGFAGLITALLATLISLTLPLSAMAAIASGVIFDDEVVSSRLAHNIVESQDVRQLIAAQILQVQAGQDDQSPFSFASALAYLEPGDREAITRILFPDGWMLAQLELNIARGYAWLETDQARPDLWLDLVPVKQRLSSGGSLQIAEIVVSSWPICTENQLTDMGADPLAILGGSNPTCQPPAPLRSHLVEYLVEGLQSEARLLPDRMPIADLGPPSSGGSAGELKQGLNRVRTLAATAWLVPASLLGVILALKVRSAADLLQWWGLPLLGSGLVGILVTAVLGFALPDWLRPLAVTWQGNPLASPLVATLRELLERALGASLIAMLMLSGVGALMLLVGGWLTRRPPRQGPADRLPGQEGPTGIFG